MTATTLQQHFHTLHSSTQAVSVLSTYPCDGLSHPGYRTQVQDYPCDGYIAPRTATIEVRLSNIDLSTSASYSLANSDAIRALQATGGKRSSDVAIKKQTYVLSILSVISITHSLITTTTGECEVWYTVFRTTTLVHTTAVRSVGTTVGQSCDDVLADFIAVQTTVLISSNMCETFLGLL